MNIRKNLDVLTTDDLRDLSKKSLETIFTNDVCEKEVCNRFAFNNFIDEKLANELIEIAEKFAYTGEGYHGDDQPHNKKEKYYSKMVEKIKEEGHLKGHALFDLREDILKLVKKYFNKSNIEIMFSQLAIRKTLCETQPFLVNLPMSHEYHIDVNETDNEQRTHTAILFLNDDFLGGNFMLQASDISPERAIPPKKGRILGFDAVGTYHGTSHIYNGDRYVFIFWFVER